MFPTADDDEDSEGSSDEEEDFESPPPKTPPAVPRDKKPAQDFSQAQRVDLQGHLARLDMTR